MKTQTQLEAENVMIRQHNGQLNAMLDAANADIAAVRMAADQYRRECDHLMAEVVKHRVAAGRETTAPNPDAMEQLRTCWREKSTLKI